jgi:hypothetical protein
MGSWDANASAPPCQPLSIHPCTHESWSQCVAAAVIIPSLRSSERFLRVYVTIACQMCQGGFAKVPCISRFMGLERTCPWQDAMRFMFPASLSLPSPTYCQRARRFIFPLDKGF